MAQAVISMHDLVGSSVGRFAIKSRLGYGGMGEVYLAEDSVLKRKVAMKAIKYEHSGDQESHQRLLKEAERASQLNDEHVARVHDVVEHDGSMFLVMEYVEGQTLRARMREPISIDEFFSIAEQCLAGLQAAHKRGILHCDLKPENLMITPTGQVKILDFGFARRIETNETRESLELSKVLMGGTPGYMAPEVLMGDAPDQRADIFSVGVVFYEALLGRHPFRIEANVGTAGRILQQEPHPIPASVPPGLDQVLMRMLAKDPARRYQSCADVLSDIGAIQAGSKPRLEKAGLSRKAITLLTVSVAVVATVLAVLTLHTRWRETPKIVQASSRHLVLLPFKPVSDDANSRAFVTGLTDTMAAKLGQLSDRYPLEIISLSEAKKQRVNDAEQARTVLGATMTLEGSMQLSGNTVRVSYKLVDTRSLRQLHSGVITADASDPFAVQDRVIDKVLSDLDIELATEDRGRVESHGTSQPQAYDDYLRGRGYLQEYDVLENLDNAIAAFQRSIQSDAKFALAYAALGQAYNYKYAATHSPELVTLARDACSRAATMEGAGAEGEACLGMLFNSIGQYQDAADHLKKAVDLDPARVESYRELGMAYERLQRLDDAESSLKQAVALRPQYWAVYKWLGRFYFDHGRADESIDQFKRVVALAPDSFGGYSNLGAVYLTQGRYAEAIAALERSAAIRPTSKAFSNLAVLYFYQHRYKDAAETYERAAKMPPVDYATYGDLAEAYDQIPGKEEESQKNYARALQLAEERLAVNSKDGAILLNAAVYAAMLGEHVKAEQYRQAGLKLSAQDPHARLRSAQVLARFHEDRRALAELKLAVAAGLSVSELTNDPTWQRFAAYPEYAAMLSQAQKK